MRRLVSAALAVALLLGLAVLVVNKRHPPVTDALDHPGIPVGDDQTKAQVIEPAKQIVSLNALRATSAGYLLMSCKNEADPPYQGAIYLTFAVPADAQPSTYLPAIAARLVSNGWTAGAPPSNRIFGSTLTKDDVSATIYRDNDDPRLGIARIHGQCRNINDHHADAAGWVDVIGELKAP